MKIPTDIRALALLPFLISLPGQASEKATIACPESLWVEQSAEQTSSEWTVFDSHKKHNFVNFRFFDGSPDQMASLVPARQGRHKSAPSDIWDFSSPAGSDGYWVACVYGESSVLLAKKLPADVTSCEVSYDPKFSSPVAKKLVCK